MNRYINIGLIFITLMITFPLHSQNVKCEILDKVIKEYDKTKGVCANFNIQTEGNGYTSVIDGKIFLKGWMFAFNTEEMECGYDGETLWTYIKNNEEINLSYPDEEEIININPYLLFKNHNKRFNCSYKGQNGNLEIISLSPKNSNDNISNVEITINNKLLYPSKIKIENKDKSKVVINVSDYNKNVNIDKTEFLFNEKQYPNIEIIDLR